MIESKFREYLIKTGHTQKSIDSRVSRLKKVEKLFNFNIDSIIYNKNMVVSVLIELKDKSLDSKNENLSNTIRAYYTCMTNDSIGKIF